MFSKEYKFQGKHAQMVRELTQEFDKSKHVFFKTNYDVYLLAPVIGFLYKRTAPIDRESAVVTKIFPEILINHEDELMFHYRLIMLLDKTHEPDDKKRIEKIFRSQEISQPDEEFYESYVRGGVEILHEKLIQEAIATEDYISRLHEFLKDFHERYHENIDLEEVLALCRKVKS